MDILKNIPSLRFPEFEGEWDLKKIGEIAIVSAGATPSTTKKEYWGGEIRWMNSGELNLKKVYEVENRITELGLKKSSTKLIPKHSILIGLAGQGKTRGTVAMNMIELCTNQSIGSILPNESYISEFIYHNLDNRYEELRALSTGDGGRGGLNLQIIKSLPVKLPAIPEQTKIASFLTAVDEKLTVLKQKKTLLEQYKKGVMQKIFSQDLRFKDDNGKEYPDWEDKKLGEVTDFYKGKGLPKSDIIENGKYKCLHYGELFTKYKELISNIKSTTNVFEKPFLSIENDVLMPTSDVTPNGLATASCILEDGVILGGDVLVIRQKTKNFNGLFFSYYVNQHRDKVMKLVSGSTVYHLYGSDMKKLDIILPCLQEQTKIANFLSAIDDKINHCKEQKEKMEIWKKGLLQKMFV